MLSTRILTAIVTIPILTFILYQGGIYWTLLFALIAALGLFEFYNMISSKGLAPLWLLGYLTMFLILFSSYYLEFIGIIIFILIFTIVLFTIVFYPQKTIGEISLSLFGSIYIGYLLHYAINVQTLNNAFWIILLAFILTWASDVGGYFFGRLFGREKIAPLLSPNKTWAGAIGSIVFSVVITIGYFSFVPLNNIEFINLITLGIIASIMAQLGDLFISSVKRYCNAKDSGNIIPGHGGVLDRFDSFILVLPTVYYFFTFYLNMFI
ncbi:Phosphatidate cytidylyltransferase [Candidatus Syntrophocurvum alkaliphilum]|uniref:Phosphatidate cytidylyltransferase n=1 Tax=Candidatus Syntrophocurvum alkaliphilum TaxID=2293317 RepID=A0A6I6DFN0_9FIRM|nr:phosphatidate cytidylyltransferase [Candidatus Syntrophocurvum alkaliphilum]QGT99201.1 Phosphatidate cytidylyltransferase [Candidatus Syntrophocurvum alkaliphilum]